MMDAAMQEARERAAAGMRTAVAGAGGGLNGLAALRMGAVVSDDDELDEFATPTSQVSRCARARGWWRVGPVWWLLLSELTDRTAAATSDVIDPLCTAPHTALQLQTPTHPPNQLHKPAHARNVDRVSSAISAYFDAIEFSAGSATHGQPPAAGGSVTGGVTSPVSPFDANALMPSELHPQTHQLHNLHRVSRLASVPSGDLEPPPGKEPQPKCCVIS